MAEKKENNEALEQAQKIIDDAAKRAEEIIKKAQECALAYEGHSGEREEIPYSKRPEIAAEIRRGEEKVPTFLFKDNEKYKDDVYVSVNADNILIRRGVDVLIPRKYQNVLRQAKKQNQSAMAYIEKYEGKNIEVK